MFMSFLARSVWWLRRIMLARRNGSGPAPAGDDLVQDAVCSALAAQQSFIPGTNFSAWMHCILRNRFISNVRRKRPTIDLSAVNESAFATPAVGNDRLALEELSNAMARLPAEQRDAILMVVVHGMSYEQVSAATNTPVGTAKSRVFRGRRQLEAWLLDREERIAAPAAGRQCAPLKGDAPRLEDRC